MHNFVQGIISFSLKNYILILFFTLILLVAGVLSYIYTPIEAYPDVTNTRVQVIAQWPGRSAEEVEKFITLPIMREMNTLPNKTSVRSVSLFGLSNVNVLFEDGIDDFYAQQYAANRLANVELPEGAEAGIEPPSGATGEIFRYVLRSDLPIKEITAINEWVVEREFLSVPGVATVASFGGEEKIYEIKVNPTALHHYDLTPQDVFDAVENSNINVGGDIISKGNQAFVVRGIGLLENISDIENLLVEVKGKTPVRVKQIAKVEISAKPRLGQVGLNDDDDVVQGIVIMLRGEDPGAVIKGLKAKIQELNDRILPENVQVEAFMDRTKLVDATVHTVLRNLIEGIILVAIIVFIFLFNWRTTLIVATVIPLAFLFAIICLKIQGLPANLISMGALDFGLLLEGTLVIVEVIYVEMERRSKVLQERFIPLAKGGLIKNKAGEVATHIFFAQIILILALMPIFLFEKVEGKMFSPLAFTLGYALLGSLILSITYVPVMCKLLLNKPIKNKTNFIARGLIDAVYSLYQFASRFRVASIIIFVIIFVLSIVKFSFWGTEFIPHMNEGAIYIRATLPNSVNLDESVRLTKEMKEKIRNFEEVDFVLTQTGRPNDGTDATGFFNIEFHTELKPEKEWSRKISKEKLIDEIEEVLNVYPGINLGFSQPIQDNVEEFVAGVKSALVIKIYGDDLHQLEDLAQQTAKVIKKVKGVEDVNVFESLGLPELQIDLDESKMAQYGVSMADAQAVIEMAIGGKAATQFYEGEKIFDVQIRYDKEFRDDEDKIGEILVPAKDGTQVPVKEISNMSFVTGPTFIYRDGSSRYVGIGFSVRGRDMGSCIADAQKAVEKEVKLGKGNKMEWAGEFESQQRATKRLFAIIPPILLLILILLYMNFGNVKDTLIAASAMPYAFIGGFVSLWVTDTIFGISAGIGFIILFGIVSIDSILLVANMKSKMRRTRNLRKAIDKAVASRVRPVLMIAFMGAVGLLPAALSNGMGSEVQKPLAIMIVGGIMICMLLSFTILPQVFYFAHRRDKQSKWVVEKKTNED